VERYEKKSSHSKLQPAKVTPQQAWTNLIANAAASASAHNDTTTLALPRHLQPYLQTMANLDNVPRKAKAFYNFTSNSLNLRGPKGQAVVTEIWNYLDSLRNASKPSVTVSESKLNNIRNTPTTGSPTAVAENSSRPHTTITALDNAERSATISATNHDSTISATKSTDSTVQAKATPADTSTRSLDLTPKGALTKKTVRKAMKHCLKGQAKLKLSRLRTLVRQRVGVDDKDLAQRRLIKQLVQTVLATKRDAFVLEGKTVSLPIR
jgi:hypothetical protein